MPGFHQIYPGAIWVGRSRDHAHLVDGSFHALSGSRVIVLSDDATDEQIIEVVHLLQAGTPSGASPLAVPPTPVPPLPPGSVPTGAPPAP